MGESKINFKGFQNIYDKDGSLLIKLVMPDALKDVFFAELYTRNKINDRADGDPQKVWSEISHKFGNAKLTAPHQVHGTEVITACGDNALPARFDADGVLIESRNSCCGSLRFADCTPVVIAGLSPLPWMMLLHSGFAGTMKNISASALSRYSHRCSNDDKDNIWAWIGPGMSFANYSRNKDDEKTKEALSIFSRYNCLEKNGHVYFDVQGQIFCQLKEAGLKCDNIFRYDACTFENNDKFYSYRGGDSLCRMFLVGGYTTILN